MLRGKQSSLDFFVNGIQMGWIVYSSFRFPVLPVHTMYYIDDIYCCLLLTVMFHPVLLLVTFFLNDALCSHSLLRLD